jgi:hypothetical protein
MAGRARFPAQTRNSIRGKDQPLSPWFDQIACVRMFGLLVRSHMNAGQDGFRDPGSKQHSEEGAVRIWI